MARTGFDGLRSEIGDCRPVRRVARVAAIARGVLTVTGFGADWRMGDRVRLVPPADIGGEIIALDEALATILTDGPADGVRPGDGVEHLGATGIAPSEDWIGRIVDPFGRPLDGRPLFRGPHECSLRNPPPAPAARKRLGGRLETGVAVFNTLLPLVRGQRIGLFAGSGVGKSTLLSKFATGVEADVIVIALVGERGRELREFCESVLGPAGLARSVVVAATSDQSALVRRRAAWTAMTVAEHFRDAGQQVLLLVDSVTRFAEAHREIALAAGETATLRGFPPSTAHLIMSLAERAGPGAEGEGDITGIFSVLVAGSDMDEPVADILRGVLDGHVVMDREIAERGRYPAINLLRSVSRALPQAATPDENALISRARRLLGAYAGSELMIRAGLYVAGSDPLVDAAVAVWPDLDGFIAADEPGSIADSFARLAAILDRAPDRA